MKSFYSTTPKGLGVHFNQYFESLIGWDSNAMDLYLSAAHNDRLESLSPHVWNNKNKVGWSLAQQAWLDGFRPDPSLRSFYSADTNEGIPMKEWVQKYPESDFMMYAKESAAHPSLLWNLKHGFSIAEVGNAYAINSAFYEYAKDAVKDGFSIGAAWNENAGLMGETVAGEFVFNGLRKNKLLLPSKQDAFFWASSPSPDFSGACSPLTTKIFDPFIKKSRETIATYLLDRGVITHQDMDEINQSLMNTFGISVEEADEMIKAGRAVFERAQWKSNVTEEKKGFFSGTDVQFAQWKGEAISLTSNALSKYREGQEENEKKTKSSGMSM